MHKKSKKNRTHKLRAKKEKPMEWNRRAEQGERGRRRACVLEALPCSRLQHCVAIPCCHQNNNPACAHKLKVHIDTKWRNFRNPRKLRRLIVSLTAPQGLSQSGCTEG